MTRTFQVGFAAAMLLFLFGATASAQRTTRQPVKRPAATTTAPVANQLELRTGADKVAVQIKNVTKFLYALGGIALRIEDLDRDSKTRTLSRSVLDSNAENKSRTIQAIRNLRAGITELEMEFRLKPGLRPFVPQIDGASQLVAESEQLAASGRFSDAGRPLLLLVEKLSDTLAKMP